MGVRAREEKRKATGLTKGAQLPGLTEPVRSGLLPPRGGIHRGCTGKRATTGSGAGEEELDDDSAEKVVELLLFRLVPAVARGVVGNTGKQRRPGAPACSGELGQGH
jgi:hypothetical protein